MEQLAKNEEGLWNANDVATYLKVSRSWVYHRAESGELPCVRIGGLLRFVPDDMRAFARGERPVVDRAKTLRSGRSAVPVRKAG
ncbi:MAG: helix-turn-helix domain-containing protein [Deltaproteobacteria bacterium]|nr:helix-turn-helix domain-containing protein [Deltaproteobacteria bacterium]